jgi:hypothetical protein
MMTKDYHWLTWHIIHTILESVGRGYIVIINFELFEYIFTIGEIRAYQNNGGK